jgi:hypothetical protein
MRPRVAVIHIAHEHFYHPGEGESNHLSELIEAKRNTVPNRCTTHFQFTATATARQNVLLDARVHFVRQPAFVNEMLLRMILLMLG